MKKYITPLIAFIAIGIFFFVAVRTTQDKPQYVNL